jgi:hypothetical protein
LITMSREACREDPHGPLQAPLLAVDESEPSLKAKRRCDGAAGGVANFTVSSPLGWPWKWSQ